jgi:molybdopterin/thiamine biosynthesis adenylyltransferase
MVRLGIGEIRIADPESFDISNINRQLAAGIHTIGLSKALETARVLRNICDDYKLIVYPQGIEQKMLETFVPGSDVIIDEIEFWNIGSCILMHKMARSLGIPIFNCLTVGFATYLHYFTPESTPVETMLGIELEEALELEQKVLDGSILEVDRNRLMRKTLDCFIPRLPQYFSGPSGNTNHDLILERLEFEGTASIISTNPPVSAGIVANHVLFELLRNCGEQRSIGKLPSSPGYIMFDSAHLEIEIVRDRAK